MELQQVGSAKTEVQGTAISSSSKVEPRRPLSPHTTDRLEEVQNEGDYDSFSCIKEWISSALTCVVDSICQLLACLGLYTSDEQKVKQFIAWAKTPESEMHLAMPSEAAKDVIQWRAEFEKLSVSAQRFAMHAFFNFIPQEGFICVQQSLSGQRVEEGSDEWYKLIEIGLLHLVFRNPGSSVVIQSLEVWLQTDVEKREVRNPFTPNKHVELFCRRWLPIEVGVNLLCYWAECYATLPERAKHIARLEFYRSNPDLHQTLQPLTELPQDRNSEPGKAAYSEYLLRAEAIDAEIVKRDRDPEVLRALQFCRLDV